MVRDHSNEGQLLAQPDHEIERTNNDIGMVTYMYELGKSDLLSYLEEYGFSMDVSDKEARRRFRNQIIASIRRANVVVFAKIGKVQLKHSPCVVSFVFSYS